MAKYTREELRTMARHVLEEKAAGGAGYTLFITIMMMKTGLSEAAILEHTKKLAMG